MSLNCRSTRDLMTTYGAMVGRLAGQSPAATEADFLEQFDQASWRINQDLAVPQMLQGQPREDAKKAVGWFSDCHYELEKAMRSGDAANLLRAVGYCDWLLSRVQEALARA